MEMHIPIKQFGDALPSGHEIQRKFMILNLSFGWLNQLQVLWPLDLISLTYGVCMVH